MNNTLKINSRKKQFTKKDIGKTFWRVNGEGTIEQNKIEEVYNDGTAKILLARISEYSSFKNEYKIKKDIEYVGTSHYGIDIIRENKEYFTNFKKAKKDGENKYKIQVSPNGNYRVGKYFDNILESFVSPITDKKTAYNIKNKLNERKGYLISYKIINIKDNN